MDECVRLINTPKLYMVLSASSPSSVRFSSDCRSGHDMSYLEHQMYIGTKSIAD
ncbi:hypothetical protein LMG28727_07380 [Paraburkholderia kirstenboschensis]|nr:hypothetical protein LMG28727_07380 [Paraburkholderia kirstenboschensis]